MGMTRLLIDVRALLEAGGPGDEIRCAYPFHRDNPGGNTLIEMAQFAAYCRRCPEAFCVTACPTDALARGDDGLIHRHNMLCVGCGSCALACPFGTIFPEVLNYITAGCDVCLARREAVPGYVPPCVSTAPDDSFRLVEADAEDPESDLWFAGEHVAVRNGNWRHKEGRS